MLIKVEIDLNYLDMLPSNVAVFGWTLTQPIVITIEVKELNLLNSIIESELPLMGFAGMHHRSALTFGFMNGTSNESYGCKDYMPRMFKEYLAEVLLQDEDCDDNEEIESLGIAQEKSKVEEQMINKMKSMPSLKKKESSGIFSKLFGKGGKVKVDDGMVAQLVDMGYEVKTAKKALEKTNNDI
jgi:hypothetical protein